MINMYCNKKKIDFSFVLCYWDNTAWVVPRDCVRFGGKLLLLGYSRGLVAIMTQSNQEFLNYSLERI